MPRSNRNIQSSVDADSLHVHKKKVHVTLLATEWCSAKGGLSTINRVLAKQFSSSPNVKVTLFVPPFECECKEKDKAEAFKCGINIEEADGKMSNSTDPLNWLAFPPEKQLLMLVMVGSLVGRQRKSGEATPVSGYKWSTHAPKNLPCIKSATHLSPEVKKSMRRKFPCAKRPILLLPLDPN